MTGATTLIFLIAPFLFLSEPVVDATKLLPSKEILQKFLDLVEAHNLNISIVTSRLQYWSNGGRRQLKDSALQLPPNTVRLTTSHLTPEIGKEWVDFANTTNKGAATYQIVNIQHGKFKNLGIIKSTNEKEIPLSPSYEKITLNQQFEKFLLDKPNYKSIYNYKTYGPKGHEQTVQVVSVKINVTLVEKSETMSHRELKIIKNVLRKYYVPLGKTIFSVICVDAIDKLIPNSSWQIVMNTKEYYIDAFKYAVFDIAETNVIIFSI